MSIKLRNIAELREPVVKTIAENDETAIIEIEESPAKKPRNRKPARAKGGTAAATTSKKAKLLQEAAAAKSVTNSERATRTTKKSTNKELPPDQKRIDTFFKSCSKSYHIEPEKESPFKVSISGSGTKRVTQVTGRNKTGRGRKRLFEDTNGETTSAESYSSAMAQPNRKRKSAGAGKKKGGRTKVKVPEQSKEPVAFVDLCLDSDNDAVENEQEQQEELPLQATKKEEIGGGDEAEEIRSCGAAGNVLEMEDQHEEMPLELILSGDEDEEIKSCDAARNKLEKQEQQEEMPLQETKTKKIEELDCPLEVISIGDEDEEIKSCVTPNNNKLKVDMFPTPESSLDRYKDVCRTVEEKKVHSMVVKPSNKRAAGSSNVKPTVTRSRRTPRPCPPYKIVAGTTFAVDAFQFGQIEGVTHYFLTHFHADHYIGLTRKFCMPLYLSPITARLVRAFIPLEEQYLHEISLDQPVVIDGVEVTAIEANHCPGAVMFLFKLPNGKCLLHTGDFRASAEMESEPAFWNNDINTIYLDTTYISNKYDFCTQHESIDNAKRLINEFRTKHLGKRILYVCGSYVIGKERFWTALAQEFHFKVWTEDNRRKALQAMQLEEMHDLLSDNPRKSEMHVIAMGKVSYLPLCDYFEAYTTHYDILLAIRPSGWEKNSRPQYRGKINIIGIEYSEHSSHKELQRFVTYIKPRDVISTVPVSSNLAITAKVPQKWYKYDKLSGMQRNFQPSITSYLKLNTKNAPNAKINTQNNKCSAASKKVSPSNVTAAESKKVALTNDTVSELTIAETVEFCLLQPTPSFIEETPPRASQVASMTLNTTQFAIAGSPAYLLDNDPDDDWLS